MAATPQPACADEALGEAVPRAMTRCECAEVSFAEIARRIREEGRTLDEICHRTGCGRTCTACLADLTRYLAAFR